MGLVACAQSTQPSVNGHSPCELFSPALARRLAGPSAQRFHFTDLVPKNLPKRQRTQAKVVDAKSCGYRSRRREPEFTAALQIDRGLFASMKVFMQANSDKTTRRVSGIGTAALISPADNGTDNGNGWFLVALLENGYSFALVASETFKPGTEVTGSPQIRREIVIDVARKIATAASA